MWPVRVTNFDMLVDKAKKLSLRSVWSRTVADDLTHAFRGHKSKCRPFACQSASRCVMYHHSSLRWCCFLGYDGTMLILNCYCTKYCDCVLKIHACTPVVAGKRNKFVAVRNSLMWRFLDFRSVKWDDFEVSGCLCVRVEQCFSKCFPWRNS